MAVRRLDACEVFFFNDTATTEIYTLSLHDALPISQMTGEDLKVGDDAVEKPSRCYLNQVSRTSISKSGTTTEHALPDRKSTRLNSSHANISYAVFCLKKKISSTFIQTLRILPTPNI